MGHGQPPRPRTVPRLNNKTGLIGMDDWMFPVPERGDRVKEHPVRHVGVRGARQGPGDHHPVEAVDHRGKPALVPVHGELGDVRDPQHVRRVGVEVPLHEVRRGLADLAGVGAPPLRPLQVHGPHGPLAHDPPDDLLRDDDRVGLVKAQHAVDGPVSPCAPTLLEQAGDAGPQHGVPVARGDRAALVIVGAAFQPHGLQTGRQAEFTPDRVDDPRPLPVRQHGRVEARVVGF